MNKYNEKGWGLASIVAFLTVGHNIVVFPWILKTIYNWYMPEFFNTGEMTWAVANGLGCFYAMLTISQARATYKSGTPSEAICSLVKLVLTNWAIFLYAWFFRGVNLL